MASNIKGMDHTKMISEHMTQADLALNNMKNGADVNGELKDISNKMKSNCEDGNMSCGIGC
jgi:hypothetical protein